MTLRVLALVLAAAGLTVAAASAQDLSPAEHYRLRLAADSLYAAGAWEAAADAYGRVHASSPQDLDALFRRARSLFMAGRTEAAVLEVEPALDGGFGPEAETAYRIGRARAEAGDVEAALEWLERALAAGFEERPVLKEDDAFGALRDDPRFRALAGLPPPGEATREERWRADLDFFLAEVRRLHADPDRVAWSDAFADEVERLKEVVPDLTDLEIAIELFGIVASLGDGHSVLYPISTETVSFPPPLPLQLYWFSDGLHVVAAEPPYERLVGRRVVAIGGRDADAILDELALWIPRDNPQGIEWLGPTLLTGPAFLRTIGLADGLDAATLMVETADGGSEDVVVRAGQGVAAPRRLGPPPGAEPPRWLRDVGSNYWVERLHDLDAVYVQFNQVRDAEGESIERFADRVKGELAAGDLRHLILDLRHNNGGNNFLMWPLVRLAIWHEESDPANRVWAIVGRNTFSAAQNLINFLDRETETTFVGEPSSSRPNFVGESTRVELPYSGLRMSISSRWWQDSYPGDDRIWIPVEVPAPLSSDDWLEGRDPAMEALAEILTPGKRGP